MDNFPSLEGKVYEVENTIDVETTRQQEMVNIKSNTDGLGVDQMKKSFRMHTLNQRLKKRVLIQNLMVLNLKQGLS